MGAASQAIYLFGLKRRAPMMLLSLGILGLAWYLLRINEAIVAAIAGLIIISWLVPERFSNLVTGAGMIGLGALLYLRFMGGTQTGLLMGIIGVVFLVMGINDVRRR